MTAKTVKRSELPATELDDAKRHWAGIGVRRGYTREKHFSAFMAAQVLDRRPSSVLDFGCHVGRNLKAIRSRDRSVRLVGVDVNATAVRWGREHWGLDLVAGDEDWLAGQADDAFDVLFTVSVIDHIADPVPVLREASRVARTLLLLEPWAGREGKLVSDPSGAAASLFSYSWDYPRRLRALGMDVAVTPYPISETGLGPLYRLHEATRR